MIELDDESTVRAEMQHRLTNHPPKSAIVGDALDEVTANCISMSNVIFDNVPPGRERSLALTKLEELSMWAKAGIARNQDAFADEPSE